MRIVVTSSMVAGSLKANAINTVKMAQGFARLGHDVTFVCRRKAGSIESEAALADLYGLSHKISWSFLPLYWETVHPYLELIISRWLFGFLAARRIRRLNPDFVYARHYIVPWLLARWGTVVAGESHAHVGVTKPAYQRFLSGTKLLNFKALITISDRLREHYAERGVPEGKMIVLEDAVDLQQFTKPHQHSLPPSPFKESSPNILYCGHLYDYKGIPTVLEAAALLPDFNFHFVGGYPEDIERQVDQARRLALNNVTFHGLKPQREIPQYLWHADLLLLPPSAKHASAAWTSPVKLYEYLASGSPVVATKIPALADWLTDDVVQFVEPDDAQGMTVGIQAVVNNQDRQRELSANGYRRAQSKSYSNRANTILEFVFQNPSV